MNTNFKREEFFSICKLFRYELQADFYDFLDPTLTVMFGKPVIDIVRFDDWLHGRFGNYEDNGLSMMDVLINNFGGYVTSKIEEVLA